MQAKTQLNKKEIKDTINIRDVDVFTVEDINSKGDEENHPFFKSVQFLFQKNNIEETIFFKKVYNHNFKKEKIEINKSNEFLYKKFIKEKINNLGILIFSMAWLIVSFLIFILNLNDVLLYGVLNNESTNAVSTDIIKALFYSSISPLILMALNYFIIKKSFSNLYRSFKQFILDGKTDYLESLEQ